MSYIITSISNEGGSPEQCYQKLKAASSGLADTYNLDMPSLLVGTLDSLMTLTDEMGKSDAIIESIVRKIEKTAMELSAMAGKKTELTVGGVPAQRYIQQFAWDFAKYPNRRPLKELVSLICGGVNSIDEELKQLATSFADKQAALLDAQRKKGGNLLMVDLNVVLTDDVMRDVEIHDTDYLKTVFIAVPGRSEGSFARDVEKIGEDLVGYGGPDWSRNSASLGHAVKYGSQIDRHKNRGSPVVPGSCKLIKQDSESLLYIVTILKSQYEPGYFEGEEFMKGTEVDLVAEFTRVCREKRFQVREFQYDPKKASQSAMALERFQVEVDGMRTGLARWCKTHYGEVFVAWMHIKVIRVFAESVLRYGLPVDFTSVLYKIRGDGGELTKALDRAFGSDENKTEEDDTEEYHDFVLLKVDA